MKIGLQVNYFNYPGHPDSIREKLVEIAKAAEAAKFDSLWMMDHYFQISPMIGKVDDPMMEAYTTLGYLAGVTKKIKLGVLVNGVIYREPAFLVKQHTSLDVLSGGRTYFGIGAGWYEREALGLGFKYPTTSERFELLEETLQIAKQMWAGDRSEYKGKHFNLKEPISSPKPISKPHPPILVGGEGEKKTLRFVAKYADACNVFGFQGARHVKKKFDILKTHCEDLGRDYKEIEKTVMSTAGIVGNPKPALVKRHCESLAKVGTQHIIFAIRGMDKIKPLEIFGDKIIPEVRKL